MGVADWYRRASGLWLPKLSFSQPHPHPCPNCCARFSGCTYFGDNFYRDDKGDPGDDWDEVAGDWWIENERLVTDDANALCICNVDNPLSETAVVAYAGMGTKQIGEQVRLIVNYVDPDNYWFIQWERAATTGTLKIYERLSGIETQRGVTAANTLLDASRIDLYFCMHSGGFYSQYKLAASSIWYSGPCYWASGAMASSTVGVGTATCGDEISIYTFSASRHKTEEEKCPECLSPCIDCEAGVPTTLSVEFGGFEDFWYSENLYCNDCEYFNDTFIFEHPPSEVDRWYPCWWHYLVSPTVCRVDEMLVMYGDTECLCLLSKEGFPFPNNYLECFHTYNTDCSSWNEEEFTLCQPPGTSFCTTASSTCHVTTVSP